MSGVCLFDGVSRSQSISLFSSNILARSVRPGLEWWYRRKRSRLRGRSISL